MFKWLRKLLGLKRKYIKRKLKRSVRWQKETKRILLEDLKAMQVKNANTK